MSGLRTNVDARLDKVNRMLQAHAGAVELIGLSEGGVVTLQFTGMCRGCELRPVTTAATIRPALLAIPGVTRVEIAGARVSEEAEHRIVESLDVAMLERWRLGAPFPRAFEDTTSTSAVATRSPT